MSHFCVALEADLRMLISPFSLSKASCSLLLDNSRALCLVLKWDEEHLRVQPVSCGGGNLYIYT